MERKDGKIGNSTTILLESRKFIVFLDFYITTLNDIKGVYLFFLFTLSSMFSLEKTRNTLEGGLNNLYMILRKPFAKLCF